jgi:hypothetical protein
LTSRDGLIEQQRQPGPCEALYSPSVFGALALRSLVARALRLSEEIRRGQDHALRGAAASRTS